MVAISLPVNVGRQIYDISTYNASTKLPNMVYMIGEYEFPEVEGSVWVVSSNQSYPGSEGWFSCSGTGVVHYWNKFTNAME